MRILSLVGLFCLLGFLPLSAQKGFDASYHLLHSSSYVQDKNFYLFTVLEKLPEVKALLTNDAELASILTAQKTRIAQSLTQCDTTTACWVNAFALNKEEQQKIGNRLKEIAKKEPSIQAMIQKHLRPSGMFIKYADQSDSDLLAAAWNEACNGLQYIIDSYAFGKKGRYPSIDSVSYPAKGMMYRRYLMSAGFYLAEQTGNWVLFFQPHLTFALFLMDMNDRDEAARHEPLEEFENRKALDYIPSIQWDKYPYAVIMQPGHGPDIAGVALSPIGKIRVALVAERYHKGLAPLIILSGGYVHPNKTPYSEAIEMKKALMEKYGVPERAILVDPHARHTTTNFRNAARQMFRYGIPTSKPSLCTTTMDQIIYITDPKYFFNQRNMRELGYLPYELGEKISPHDVVFKPVITSLHADPLDPLDP